MIRVGSLLAFDAPNTLAEDLLLCNGFLCWLACCFGKVSQRRYTLVCAILVLDSDSELQYWLHSISGHGWTDVRRYLMDYAQEGRIDLGYNWFRHYDKQ